MIGLSNFLMQIPAGFEWVFIIISYCGLFFGVKKIPEIAKSFGRAKTEYEKSKIEARRELQKVKKRYSKMVMMMPYQQKIEKNWSR